MENLVNMVYQILDKTDDPDILRLCEATLRQAQELQTVKSLIPPATFDSACLETTDDGYTVCTIYMSDYDEADDWYSALVNLADENARVTYH